MTYEDEKLENKKLFRLGGCLKSDRSVLMRQAQNRSTRWILLSLFFVITLLLFTWESNPPTTTLGTTGAVFKNRPVTEGEVPLKPRVPSFAGHRNAGSQDLPASFSEKLSPILRDEISFLAANPQFDYDIPVIVKVSPDFFAESADLFGEESSPRSNQARTMP